MSERSLTPNDLARRYGIGIGKVLGWINRGELKAINVARVQGGRPQWVIPPEALAEFEAKRAATPRQQMPRRRKPQQPVTRYH